MRFSVHTGPFFAAHTFVRQLSEEGSRQRLTDDAQVKPRCQPSTTTLHHVEGPLYEVLKFLVHICCRLCELNLGMRAARIGKAAAVDIC